MRKSLSLLLVICIFMGFYAYPQTEQEKQGKNLLDKVLAFIDTIAQYLGKGIINLIEVISKVTLPDSLITPVGYLGVLTIALALFGLMEAARKIIWLVVILGWGLIILRVVMEILNSSKQVAIRTFLNWV